MVVQLNSNVDNNYAFYDKSITSRRKTTYLVSKAHPYQSANLSVLWTDKTSVHERVTSSMFKTQDVISPLGKSSPLIHLSLLRIMASSLMHAMNRSRISGYLWQMPEQILITFEGCPLTRILLLMPRYSSPTHSKNLPGKPIFRST